MENQVFLLLSFILSLHFVTSSAATIPKNSIIAETSTENCYVKLNFSNINFGSIIGSDFISSPYVKSIILKNNHIAKFEKDTFNTVPNLEYLELSYNDLQLSNLFSFGGHKNLKTLILDYNNKNFIRAVTTTRSYYYRRNYHVDDDYYDDQYYSEDTELKESSYTFPELKNLSLRKINMKSASIKWNFNFPQLSTLDLSENNLQDSFTNMVNNFPLSISKLTVTNAGLTSLSISPSCLDVSELYLDNNKFHTVTSNYTYYSLNKNILHINLQDLEKFSISNCGIEIIKTDAFINMENLLELNISNNKFIEIKNGTFDHLLALRSLDLSQNRITKMPDIHALQNLNSLTLDYMKNKTLFKTFDLQLIKNLKVLSLQGNEIEFISQQLLNNLPSLEELNLSENKISVLPSWNSQNVLKILKLNQNYVSDLDDLSLLNVESLKTVDLRNNSLTNIVKKSLKFLQDDTIITI